MLLRLVFEFLQQKNGESMEGKKKGGQNSPLFLKYSLYEG